MKDILIEGDLLWVAPQEHHRDGLGHIRDGVVVHAGSAIGFDVPGGTPRLDATGCTVLPGLIDTQVHLTTNSDHRHVVTSDNFPRPGQRTGEAAARPPQRSPSTRRRFTTLRVMGHRDVGEVELRDSIDQGPTVGPRLVLSPWWITMTNGHGNFFYPPCTPRRRWDSADGVDDCRTLVRLQAREGADFIKVMANGGMSRGEQPHWPNYSLPELTAVVAEAHDMDLRVAAHAVSIEGIRRCLEAGVDSIEHGSFLDEEAAAEMSRQGTFLVPTMAFNDWCQREGTKRGLTSETVEKLGEAHDRTIESLALARVAGVRSPWVPIHPGRCARSGRMPGSWSSTSNTGCRPTKRWRQRRRPPQNCWGARRSARCEWVARVMPSSSRAMPWPTSASSRGRATSNTW